MNNERKTPSMLQRIPVILAVTAASYGLQVPPQSVRSGQQPVAERSQPAGTLGVLPKPELRT